MNHVLTRYIYIYNLCLLITGIITLPRRFFSVSQEALGHSFSTLQLDGSDRLWYGQGQGPTVNSDFMGDIIGISHGICVCVPYIFARNSLSETRRCRKMML